MASAVNNDVARVAGLVAVAALPIVAGISAKAYANPSAFSHGFRNAMWITAVMCEAGGLLSWVTIRRPAAGAPESTPTTSCALEATPLRVGSARC